MHLTRRHFCGIACSAAALGATGCAVNPATGQRNFMLMSQQDERKKGAEMHPEVIKEFGGVYRDTRITKFVSAIGARLARGTEQPNQSYTFTVLDSPVINAFALPGGYVYISRGLMALAGSEAELAGVLGHELGHVVARHAAQRYSRGMVVGGIAGIFGAVTQSETVGNVFAGIGDLAFVRPFSRDQELEADRLGVRYISRAGYDPGAMVSFLAKMRESSRLEAKIAGRDPNDVDAANIMSTHPRTADRVRRAVQLAGATAGQGRIERDSYLRRLDRIIYGDSPSQGFVRGRKFIHPEARLGFEMPEGFRLENRPDSVIAARPGKAIILFDSESEPFDGGMTAYLANDWGKEAELEELKSATLNGMAAATAKTTIQVKRQQLLLRIAAVRFDKKHIYRFMGLSPAEHASYMQGAFQKTISSFRKLGAAEAARVKPWRIRIVGVRKGDTVYGISNRSPFEKLKKERFLVMNGLDPKAPLAAGAKVKLVLEQ